MASTRYRRGKIYAADLAVYTREMAMDNTQELSRLKRNLVMRQIGDRLGIDRSTVSRTIKRGEQRLQRCLRYGAEAYLRNIE